MEKKMILVGMKDRVIACDFMNTCVASLRESSVDIIYIDYYRMLFRTPNTEVRYICFADGPHCLDGIRADAIFGREEYRSWLRHHAKLGAEEPIKKNIGLVDYICRVEREAMYRNAYLESGTDLDGLRPATLIDEMCMYPSDLKPRAIYISTARNNGRTAFESAVKRYLAEHNVPYIDIRKGEEKMAEAANIYIRQDIESAARLAAAMQEVRDRMKSRRKLPGIKNVHFSGPCTVVIWDDKTKTVVRCKDNDVVDYEKGLAMAIAKKALGTNKSGSNYYDIFKKWLPKPEEEEQVG